MVVIILLHVIKNAKGFVLYGEKRQFFLMKKVSQKNPCNEIIPASLNNSAVCTAGFQQWEVCSFFLD